jgi:heme O synthase-like polyprenyltransferase
MVEVRPIETSLVKPRRSGGVGHTWILLVLLVVTGGTIAAAASVARYFRLYSTALIDTGATRRQHRPSMTGTVSSGTSPKCAR